MKQWVWLPQPKPSANLRLYCLPHAGGGASTFASWISACPDNIEMAAIQLPGRETRLDEEPMRRLPLMARAIGEVISLDHRPFAIFGHSAGGKLAIHVASYLQDIDMRPTRVFLSGAPMTVPRSRFLHHLSQDKFVHAVGERFGWLEDKYGVSWQVIYTPAGAMGQKLTPALMFVGEVCGKAEEAIGFYQSVFRNAPDGARPEETAFMRTLSSVMFGGRGVERKDNRLVRADAFWEDVTESSRS